MVVFMPPIQHLHFAEIEICSGLFESICLLCHSVVATGASASDLYAAEHAHTCLRVPGYQAPEPKAA